MPRTGRPRRGTSRDGLESPGPPEERDSGQELGRGNAPGEGAVRIEVPHRAPAPTGTHRARPETRRRAGRDQERGGVRDQKHSEHRSRSELHGALLRPCAIATRVPSDLDAPPPRPPAVRRVLQADPSSRAVLRVRARDMALSVRELRSTARDIYDLTAEEYLELFGPHQHDGYHVTWRESPIEAQENLIRVMAERSELRPGESVLDVGCGIGGTALWLEKNKGCRVTGISNSTEQVVLARRLARDARSAARFLQQDAERLAVDAPVDVVLDRKSVV